MHQLIQESKSTNQIYEALVIRLLADRIKAIGDSVERQKLRTLGGKAALANARLVYRAFTGHNRMQESLLS
jgi:hypothetical protein